MRSLDAVNGESSELVIIREEVIMEETSRGQTTLHLNWQ